MYAMFDGSIVDITMSAKGEERISNHFLHKLYIMLYTITHTQGSVISLEFPVL